MKKPTPYEFVLEALAAADPVTRPMFGCVAVYVGEKIVLILREKDAATEDNGVWIATTSEHHESLRRDLPSLRSIGLFGPGPTAWQNLPAESDDFEESALRACRFVLEGDPRIGKIPQSGRKKRLGARPKPGSRRLRRSPARRR